MKEQQYKSVEAIETAVTKELNSIPVEAFQKAMMDLKTCSKRCIELREDYVEA